MLSLGNYNKKHAQSDRYARQLNFGATDGMREICVYQLCIIMLCDAN